MPISSLNTLNRSIKNNVFLSLLALLIICLLSLNIIYNANQKNIQQKNKNEINSNFSLLKSNLSEKLSIIASSNFFIDYLRSGSLSRSSLKSELIYNIRSSKLKEIEGVEILNDAKKEIFFEGSRSNYYVTLPLCYFDRVLDTKLGSCADYITIYLNKGEIAKSLKNINENLVPCTNCQPQEFLSGNKFGSFEIYSDSHLPLNYMIKSRDRLNIYTIDILISIFMIILGIWSWRKTHSILNKYINSPIEKITAKLKDRENLKNNIEVEELRYLVDEIQERENRLKEVKDNENLIQIGKIASQVAHDIRSPLTIINTVVDDNKHSPTDDMRLLKNATDQLTNIADSVLDKFRNGITNSMGANKNYLPKKFFNINTILREIVFEKEAEYKKFNITLKLQIQKTHIKPIVNLSSSDFKRVISNLLNNAVEAITTNTEILIKTYVSDGNIHIQIQDSGIGMRRELIDEIISGSYISNKRNGVGIGINSAIRFVESWGGNFNIKSELNLGTVVTITLPLLRKNQFDKVDLILIDDNTVVTDAWKLAAISKNKKINIFNDIDEAKSFIDSMGFSTPIYIDSDLKSEKSGQEYAKEFYDLGYSNLFLTTGYHKESFEPMYWIKDIVTKAPPF